MKRISFFVNGSKPGASAVRDRLAALALECGLDVMGAGSAQPDAVVVLGGDGTMLSAVHRFPGVPLLGLNLGSLGYLASVEEARFDDAIRSLSAGRYGVSRRTALKVRGVNALNDVVVSRGVTGHAIRLDFSVDGEPVTRFVADGLVVATPTGSTAYSLAAGGPVLMPASQSFVVTPVCPHALSSRPLVLKDSARMTVSVEVRERGDEPVVFADGRQVCTLSAGESLEIEKSDASVPLVELDGVNPYEVLTRKLGWSGSSIRARAEGQT